MHFRYADKSTCNLCFFANWKQTSKEILLSWLLVFLLFSSWRIWYCLENNTVSLANRQSVPCSLKLKIFLFQYFGQFCFDILKIKTYFGMENLKQRFLSNIQPSLSWENLLKTPWPGAKLRICGTQNMIKCCMREL